MLSHPIDDRVGDPLLVEAACETLQGRMDVVSFHEESLRILKPLPGGRTRSGRRRHGLHAS
jgi:hypothetical protein